MAVEFPNKKTVIPIFFAAMLCILLAVIAVRLQALQLPLERDEGEFALMGQLILDGNPPYKEVFGQKLPGIYAAYAAIMAVFGQNCSAIHLGLLFTNVLTVFLLFLLAKELLDPITAIVAASSYALLSTHHSVHGLAAHATHFVILFAVAGMLLLLQAFKRRRLRLYFVSGMLFGVAFLMKQPGFFFGAIAAFLLILGRREQSKTPSLTKTLALYIAGFALPYVIVCFALYAAGVFDQFWFWTYEYAKAYGSRLDFNTGRQLFKYSFGLIFSHYPILWICAGIGAACIFLIPAYRKHWLFFETLLISSFLALGAGFYFRSHYFVLLLPVASLLIGVALSNFHKILYRITGKTAITALITVGLFIAFIADTLVRQYGQVQSSSFERISHAIYDTNPFPESIPIAKYINTHSSAFDRIAVLGSEPQIYFYSKRRPASPHIYMYPMMESHSYAKTMQSELIREIERRKPKYIVLVDIPTSWLIPPDSEQIILDWANRYLKENYTRVMAVEVDTDGNSRYFPGPEAKNKELPAGRNIELFELR